MEKFIIPMLGGAGAILVGFIASPLLEVLKSKFQKNSLRAERKRELIANLRIALGYMDAFCDQINRAVPNPSFSTALDPEKLAAWREVQAFNIDKIRQFIETSNRIEVNISESSSVGQSLVKRITLCCSAAEQIKLIMPIVVKSYDHIEGSTAFGNKPKLKFVDSFALPEDAKLAISHFKKCDLSLRRFIVGIYAQKLEINNLSLAFDKEIIEWDYRLSQLDAEMNSAESQLLHKNHLNKELEED